ncbi:hypothetical protein [Sphingobium sp. WCS2017Hpa-17]|uniref:hypothetical protein n=1 Tax=Sphingobium sp. WCS2017Hpa-17 TaxID=3073638 RepID=UPI00288BE6EF|nr:hypothetical protein [Sphingobium sp. WCS2017Hpa-17]
MTIDPSISSAGPIGAISAVGEGARGASPVDAIRAVATNVVSGVAASFGLLPVTASGQGDVYGLRAASDALGEALGGSAADQGALTRAVEDFASVVATDMTAYADGRTLTLVDGALAASTLATAGDIAGIIDGLDQARVALEGAR